MSSNPRVAVIMGSQSDWEVMQSAVKILKDFGVSCEARVMSAHRAPELVSKYVRAAPARGTKCIIAAAGGAAHLAGRSEEHTSELQSQSNILSPFFFFEIRPPPPHPPLPHPPPSPEPRAGGGPPPAGGKNSTPPPAGGAAHLAG